MAAPTTESVMYQTIQRQPSDLRRLLDTGWDAAEEVARRLSPARRIVTTGIGTSYHAALAGAWFLRAAGCDARAVSSFDLALYPEAFDLRSDDAVILMAHTGTRQYSTQALEQAAAIGATSLAVCGLTAEQSGAQFVLRTVERERSAAFTASHLAAMTVMAQVAAVLGEQRRAPLASGFREALGRLPGQVEDVLARQDTIQAVAREAVNRRIYAVGAGPNEATALEAVIKVREAAQGWIDGLALEQFLHGPIVPLNAGDQAILIQVPGRAAARGAGIAQIFAAVGAELWVVGEAIEGVNATVFPLPQTPELLSPLLAVVPMQLFAYFMAAAKGINPDAFRSDDERYRAAFRLVKL